MSKDVTVTGTVWAVFAHRFAIDGGEGRVLADLGPHGAELVRLKEGDAVTIRGERKPSEIKASHVRVGEGPEIALARPKPDHRGQVDETGAKDMLAAVRAAGYEPSPILYHKKHHVEIRASRGDQAFEVHLELDGRIRHVVPIESSPVPGPTAGHR